MTFDWSQLLDEINGLFVKTTRDKIFKNEKDDFLKHVQTCLKLNDSEDWNYILASEDILEGLEFLAQQNTTIWEKSI